MLADQKKNDRIIVNGQRGLEEGLEE